jgi:phosphopantothenoylcysteine decarboxylase/phosphopantothenate--cysteine ligase
MGYALAARALARGAEVTLVSGPSALPAPAGARLVPVETAAEMRDAVLAALPGAAAVLKAAAPADYRAAETEAQKLKKGREPRELRLVPTDDILALVRERKDPGTLVVGFAAETENLHEHALDKLRRKGLDLCVANRVGAGLGFDTEMNQASLVHPDGRIEDLPLLPKPALADLILDRVAARLRGAGREEP